MDITKEGKHVTIDAEAAPSPDGEPIDRSHTAQNGILAVPSHWPQLGEEGYRTPTIEDFELQHARHDGAKPELDTSSKSNAHQHLPQSPNEHLHSHAVWTRHMANASGYSLGERLLESLHWRERIRHFTWTFFTMTMATGGIANVIYEVPFRFPGLYAIGMTFFLLNIVLFIFNVLMISLRFYHHPEMFHASLLHPTERLFIPAAVVSFGTILLNISQYGPNRAGHWLYDIVTILYWIDAGLAFLASMGIYLVMWSTASFTISQMTPVWIFPAYPLLIIGPHASVLSQQTTPETQRQGLLIIIGGFTLQGIGFLVSLMIYAAFIYRLMTQKLPQEATRPGMFVSVGPSGFTAAALIGMAEGAQRALPSDFMSVGTGIDPTGNGDTSTGDLAKLILRVIASWTSLWLWGLAFWFFFISVGAHIPLIPLIPHHKKHNIPFTMTWFSYVFPNTALITATFAVGKTFDCKPIQIIGCVMTPILILVWFWVMGMMIRAVKKRQILWPQKGEDKDEGGFKEPPRRNSSPLQTRTRSAFRGRSRSGVGV